MKVLKGKRITIKPTAEQRSLLRKTEGCCRWLWNRFLAQNKDEYSKNKRFIFYNEMSKQLPKLKKEYPWLKEVNSQSLQHSLKKLDKAITSVSKLKFGFPKFKSRNDNEGSFYIPQHFKATEDFIILPKIGELKYRKCKDNKNIHLKNIKNITITYDRLKDRFIASLCYEEEVRQLPATNKIIGLDAGSVRLITDSNGDYIKALRDLPVFQHWQGKVEKAQKAFSDILMKYKKNINEVNIKKQLKRKKKDLAYAHRKLAAFCRDFLHKQSIKIVQENDLIAVEDLKIKNMTKSAKGTLEEPGKNVKQKSGLNRNLISNRISMFYSMLKYKSNWNGKLFVEVDPKYTSQTCSSCGFKHADNRVNQASFKCLECGHEMNADHNASINILTKAVNEFWPLCKNKLSQIPMKMGSQAADIKEALVV